MFIAGTMILLSAAAAFSDPVFINIGDQAAATDMSADGSVVVGTQNGSIFRWTQSSGMTLIGSGTEPRVSADGSTMAWQGSGNVYRWTGAQGATIIGTSVASPAAISGDGSTVAWGNQRWSTSGWSTTLQTPAGTTGVARVASLNFDGSVAVGGTTTLVPSRWDGSGQGISLGSIAGYPVSGSASVVTLDGQTVLGRSTSASGDDIFRWRSETGMVGVNAGLFAPDLFAGTTGGDIAVGSYIAQAFVSRAGFGSALLNSLLHDQYGIDLHNLDLEYARGISGDGRTVVGYGWDYSDNHQFAWYVHVDSPIPAPGTAGGLALLLAAGFRRRR